MPPRKKAIRRPRTGKTVRSIARQEAKKVVAKSIETKSRDSQLAYAAVDATIGIVNSFTSGMIRGTGDTEYIGQQITPISLDVRWIMDMFASSADNFNSFRVLIIQDKAQGVPTIANIFESSGNNRTPLSAIDRLFNETYKIVYDSGTMLVSASGGPSLQKVGHIHISGKRLRKIVFNDAVATPESGGLYFIIVSDSTALSHPLFTYYARLQYKDA